MKGRGEDQRLVAVLDGSSLPFVHGFTCSQLRRTAIKFKAIVEDLSSGFGYLIDNAVTAPKMNFIA